MKLKIAIFISGRGSNLENIIKSIEKKELNNIEIVCAFSNKADAYGLEIAKSHNIPSLILESKNFPNNDKERYDEEILKLISPFNPDFICLAGYMKILTSKLLSSFPDKVINIHPSLLPSFKGLDGQKQALDYGVKIAGCTTHYVDPGVDTGKIIAQAAITTENCTNEDELAKKILKAEHYLYIYTLKKITNEDGSDKLIEKAYNDKILIY